MPRISGGTDFKFEGYEFAEVVGEYCDFYFHKPGSGITSLRDRFKWEIGRWDGNGRSIENYAEFIKSALEHNIIFAVTGMKGRLLLTNNKKFLKYVFQMDESDIVIPEKNDTHLMAYSVHIRSGNGKVPSSAYIEPRMVVVGAMKAKFYSAALVYSKMIDICEGIKNYGIVGIKDRKGNAELLSQDYNIRGYHIYAFGIEKGYSTLMMDAEKKDKVNKEYPKVDWGTGEIKALKAIKDEEAFNIDILKGYKDHYHFMPNCWNK